MSLNMADMKQFEQFHFNIFNGQYNTHNTSVNTYMCMIYGVEFGKTERSEQGNFL